MVLAVMKIKVCPYFTQVYVESFHVRCFFKSQSPARDWELVATKKKINHVRSPEESHWCSNLVAVCLNSVICFAYFIMSSEVSISTSEYFESFFSLSFTRYGSDKSFFLITLPLMQCELVTRDT